MGPPPPQSVPNNYISHTFLTLKTDNIAKLRIELKSILLETPSNKIKGTYIYKCKLVLLWSSFYFFTGIEGKCGWIIEGGGGKGYVAPHPKLLVPPDPPDPPLPTPICLIYREQNDNEQKVQQVLSLNEQPPKFALHQNKF